MKHCYRAVLQLLASLIFYLSVVVANADNTSRFSTGVTFTQYSLDGWGDPDAVARGKTLLENSTRIVNQHIMGFGAVNPEPSPDDYQFESIDRRIGNFNGAGKNADVIVLTACCAPDWMKGGTPGSTDWSQIEVAPFPQHFDDYAELVAELVSRPEYFNIKYVQVWNEMKGFWDISRNRWNHESYTNLYNKVWDAVKAVRPDIRIGGPYVVLNSFGGASYFSSEFSGSWGTFDYRDLDVITYWLKNKKGADFVVVDSKIRNRDDVRPVSDFARTTKFADFVTWLRRLDESEYPGARDLPVWYAEWYAIPDDPNASDAEKNALMATGMIRTIRAGVSTALVWGPQGDANGQMFPLGLFSDTGITQGGAATLYHQTHKHLHDHFSAGALLIDVDSGNASVEILATASKALVVNMSSTGETASVDGRAVNLDPYQVLLIDRANVVPGISVTDTIVNEGDGQASVSVELTTASPLEVKVTAFTRPNNAQPGQDFFGKTETLSFAPGQVEQTLVLDILNDITIEPDETIQIRLIDPVNAQINDASALLTIIDNDRDSATSEIAIESATVSENSGTAEVKIRLSHPNSDTVSLTAFTQIITASPPSDYYGKSMRIIFEPGQTLRTFDVEIRDDTESEDTELVGLRINNAQGATIAVNRAQLSILDDD